MNNTKKNKKTTSFPIKLTVIIALYKKCKLN